MDLLFYYLLILTVLEKVSCRILRDNKCSVYDGKCKYDILMSSDCFKPSQAEYRIQNDNDKQMNEIEKQLSNINSENSKRLQELEKTITNLIMDTYKKKGSEKNGGSNNALIAKPLKYLKNRHLKIKSSYHKADENDLLLILQKKFEQLRKQLANCLKSKKYFDKEIADLKSKLSEARDKIKELETYLSLANKQLSFVQEENQKLKNDLQFQLSRNNELEKLLKDLKEELNEKTKLLDIADKENGKYKTLIAKLRNEIEKLSIELEKTKYRLIETENLNKDLEGKLGKAEDELSQVRIENERLISELKIERKQHNETKEKLQDKNYQFDELNITYAFTLEQLNNKTLDLVECFRAKTAQYCGFEDEMICGFIQDNNTDVMDWRRHSERTPSTYTGPQHDHTCRNSRGHYMYIEASSRSRGQKALLWSPRYQGPGEMCVEFYYHMYGDDIGTLNVHTQTAAQILDESEEFEIVWRAYGNQGDVWIRAYLSVTEEVARAGFNVIFEGVLESGHAGDIAIDDFKVWDGTCS